jgi:membrane dipeptidase
VVDLHCHYPMHLLAHARAPRDVIKGMSRVRGRPRWLDRLRAAVLLLAARVLNFRNWRGDWRVSLEGLESGGVQVLCSVLYDPFAEIDLDECYGAPPEPGYYRRLVEQIETVERDLRTRDPDRAHHVLVCTKRDLDEAIGSRRVGFVHAIEGGFHLGAEPSEIDEHVGELAARGVRYVTLAHLFWREVATNAPAIPLLPDRLYDVVFRQPKGVGLTDLGVAALEAMYQHRVLVDLSHMREAAIHEALDRLEALDREHGRDPTDFPVIASHSAFRLKEHGGQAYNLTPETVKRIDARSGVVGIIFAQHQLNEGTRRRRTRTIEQSIDVIERHVRAIEEHGSIECVAIGTDLDGFIKPTIGGVDDAFELAPFRDKMRERFGADAEKILTTNALRVLRAVLPD